MLDHLLSKLKILLIKVQNLQNLLKNQQRKKRRSQKIKLYLKKKPQKRKLLPKKRLLLRKLFLKKKPQKKKLLLKQKRILMSMKTSMLLLRVKNFQKSSKKKQGQFLKLRLNQKFLRSKKKYKKNMKSLQSKKLLLLNQS